MAQRFTLAERPMVDVYGDFRSRFGAFVKVRNVLVRQLIRAHVFSGIEFQMFVFIVGPLVHWITGTTLIAGGLLAAFELLLIVKLCTATRSYLSYLGDAGPAGGTGQQRVPVAPPQPVAAQH